MRFNFLVILLALLILECSTTPLGRRQLILNDDSTLNEMGEKAFNEMKTTIPIEKSPAINNYVKCISYASIKEATDTTGVQTWEIVVFRDSAVNAFALPGGKIGVYTGILQVANSADKLAAVIGHEIAHVIARHGNERVSQSMVASGGMAVLQGFGGEAAAGILGAGAQYGVILPFSRKHESEADVIGLEIMSKAGFDPQASVSLWQGMAALGGDKPHELMSTHPSDDTRIKELQDNMPAALANYSAAKSQGKTPNCKI
ncbi:M48 family metallopeptidase [Leptospira sp. GIMC2001]|uniref:M48 family metallopeptidase n=1 Tax=Leptospira sp. GIMC2001 TaxID=1513297 RepID=UPI00234AD0B3|nr:M48 family metallopeptidase [Leptospira sp. GIMC2001]WCL48003.1 M48 family metallopeptidase [Leptospira sp. GIMC2001]